VAGDLSIPEHGDVVADPHQLLEPVRNVDDRHPLRLQLPDDLEKDVHLRRRKGRRRLVENKDAGIERDRLGDLDQLLLANRQVFDERLGIDPGIEPVEEPGGPLDLRAMIDAANAPGQLPRREDVLGNREIAEQIELLEDHADAVALRVGRRMELHLLAVEQDAAE
jgi:hypothetical protein